MEWTECTNNHQEPFGIEIFRILMLNVLLHSVLLSDPDIMMDVIIPLMDG
jgi:hypothetical protein